MNISKKQILLSSLDNLPDNLLEEVFDFVSYMKFKSVNNFPETLQATQNILANDWLKPEEEKAWQDL